MWCSHSQECVSETYSIIENGNLTLNDDSHETGETIHEFVVIKPICDDDFLQEDQLIETVVFHEDDRVVMFNNIEEFFLFKDYLEYEFEEYEPKRDSMPEIESEFPMLEEFTTNTQIAEIQTSICPPMDQQPSVLSNQNEECAFFFMDLKTR